MTDMTSFDAMLKDIETLITGRNHIRDFEAAYRLAREVTLRFPGQPAAWSQRVLAANLVGKHHDALEAQASAEAQCAAWTGIDSGDCERDHAIYNIFNRRPVRALQHLRAARTLHTHDADRSALLDNVEGQWWYMLGDYGMALSYFLAAASKWQALEQRSEVDTSVKPPRPQWRFNGDRRLLKAIVALEGARGEARELYTSLLLRMSNYGSPDLAWRLRLVMTGRAGNWLESRIESPTSRRFLAKIAPLARRLLPVR